MNRPGKQIAILLLALAMTATPALGCCVAFMDHGHAPPRHKAAPHGHMAAAAMAEHCAGSVAAPPAPRLDERSGDHNGERHCDDCPPCGGADLATQDVAALPKSAASHSGGAQAILPATASRTVTPPVWQILPPPHGPPVFTPTPVNLKTTLRL